MTSDVHDPFDDLPVVDILTDDDDAVYASARGKPKHIPVNGAMIVKMKLRGHHVEIYSTHGWYNEVNNMIGSMVVCQFKSKNFRKDGGLLLFHPALGFVTVSWALVDYFDFVSARQR